MASKTKMRCTTCGKWFQSANAKDTLCPDCAQKARKEKLAAKAAPPATVKATGVSNTPPPPPKPKPKPEHAQSGTSSWLDTVSDVKIAPPEPPRPKIISSPTPRVPRPDEVRDKENTGDGGSSTYRENRNPNRDNSTRPPNGPYRVGGGSGLPDAAPRPRQPMEGGFNRGPRPDRPPRPVGPGGPKGGKPKVKMPKPPPPPKPKKEKVEPPKPFVPTAEQITQVETRYLELATPMEFDGIRTQIAQELEIPKTAVKKIIKDLRDRQHIPSWWEAQTFKGSEEDLAKIRVAYEPYLPLPDVGIHKKIAEDLSLKAGDVYQAIKQIRTEMGLPQYNDPELHPDLKEKELQRQKAKEEAAARKAAAAAESQSASSKAPVATESQPVAETPVATESQPVAEIPATEAQPASSEPSPAPVPTDALSGTDTQAVVEAIQEKQEAE